ncbi:MAG TPA: addiction module protein [Terriglobia bacterium]|nr:addiction module protein [Terriglobia bacterium]
MSVEELEAAALKLDMHERARLAETLLGSLEDLSSAEAERLWAQEALRRLVELDQDPTASRPAEDVLRGVRSRLE